MFKFYNKMVLQQSIAVTLNRLTPFNWHAAAFASAGIAEAKNNTEEEKQAQARRPSVEKGSSIVKTVFASIQLHDSSDDIQTPFTDSKLLKAQTVNELLTITDGTGISRKHALQVVSILSTWTSSGKIQLSEFDSDPRFLKLCKVLTRGTTGSKSNKQVAALSKHDDLSTVLSVAADEEAAKLVGSITLSQMIKVLTTLSLRKRRSVLLLRTLAYNIAGSSEQMNIKQCADLFYSIATLNFYDENLFEKAADNVISILQQDIVKKSAVVGSILTSMGLLKYRNPVLLDAISHWIIKNTAVCRPQDIFSLFMSLGVLNYVPSNSDHLFKVLVPQLTQEEAGKPAIWLEVVWSLILLNQASHAHVMSVLNDTFIDKLAEKPSISTSAILKLLNIDGAAHYLLTDYSGPKIAQNHNIRQTCLQISREKAQITNSVIDALKNLIPESYLRNSVNTGLGFYIDAECVLDKNCNPLPLNETIGADRIRVAVLTYDYHDVCKGKMELTGITAFHERLLEAMGYQIVSIPFTDFKVTEKIVKKVQYLENRLKQAVQQ
ncbi:FAST kinase domain-containing protein 4 [Dendroctonus ponderosae]|uniref:RAP domain-containing protein n=1 Tax=Dendroctonus ponderosae TaxID=77166 RepID=J3JXV2_DENPD|nr:FAST kinase domain-containing protein 4 [Dendroctonus ponderosae]XP_019768213.1 FAST kinase domain-containing protein 4 [Dendroctonus ponderosae]XP_048517149.1 FAST kinase domain-containing protein 4 [Dendroctonus ponderosae]AEE63035.1 unknown [Dendroctonus ponderosae]KAH1019141.1 hypothetical protein HUJ04_009005 [Dendroctonus ponderosae]KAH1026344.1 hypothetical protein HUJ05_000021 [Dendroctonus ponderosae]